MDFEIMSPHSFYDAVQTLSGVLRRWVWYTSEKRGLSHDRRVLKMQLLYLLHCTNEGIVSHASKEAKAIRRELYKHYLDDCEASSSADENSLDRSNFYATLRKVPLHDVQLSEVTLFHDAQLREVKP